MEKDMNRAVRRHHTARLKNTRRFFHGDDLVKDPVQLGKTVATPASCSCFMCGNPRKYGEQSMQEKRAAQREHVLESEPID